MFLHAKVAWMAGHTGIVLNLFIHIASDCIDLI
jgi:hypothetical protein